MRATKLRKARDLVAKGWCQGVGARNKQGGHTWTFAPDASSFCAIGALRRAEVDGDSRFVVCSLVKGQAVALFNDAPGRTQAEVVELFDWAIGIQEAGGL